MSLIDAAVPSRGTLVDAPCGSGYLSMKAVRSGWTVRPVDLFPKGWRGDPTLAPLRADLNGPLPLKTSSADALVCCEGLEHLECPFNALREFRRIVKPGGIFVISIPNTLDIRQRWRMFRTGHWHHYFPDQTGHVNHMGTFVLGCTLIRDGWTIEAVRAPKMYGGYLAPLVPFFRLGKDSRFPENVRAMRSTREVLLGRTLLFLARNTFENG